MSSQLSTVPGEGQDKSFGPRHQHRCRLKGAEEMTNGEFYPACASNQAQTKTLIPAASFWKCSTPMGRPETSAAFGYGSLSVRALHFSLMRK